MPRLPRIVLPGIPHHVTQRSKGRKQVFFKDEDYEYYLKLLSNAAKQAKATIWSYCLMPNHVHIVVVPSNEDGLRRTFGETHRLYADHINARDRKSGPLWQGRFSSVAMDEQHLFAAFRYIALNPVRAGLVRRAQQWQWSSTRAFVEGKEDGVVELTPVQERIPDFAAFLDEQFDEGFAYAALRKAERSGRPVGSKQWIADVVSRKDGDSQ